MINQVGYRCNDKKEIRVCTNAKEFIIKKRDTEIIVFKGVFANHSTDLASGDLVSIGDFSSITQEGSYTIGLLGEKQEFNFKIDNNVYTNLHNGLLKMFYYQRCGQDLLKPLAGPWSHGACHTQRARIYGSDVSLDVSGGWHDAGDYGRYVVPASKALADLFLARAMFPLATSVHEIPLLNETKYELDWLFKMQDDGGGVFHKVTTASFVGNIMPEESTEELIISPISACATADFAAIMALAYRVYKKLEPEYAIKALDASKKAWLWLEAHENFPGFRNPKEIVTGQYEDDKDGDERFWAAVELFLSTEEEKYHTFLVDSYTQNKWDGLGWADVGTYGVISYIISDISIKNNSFQSLLTKDFLDKANKICGKSKNDGYGISLGVNYIWGSNEIVADNAIRLLVAEKITGDSMYNEYALDHIHYLLGVNPLSKCYVTGFGDDPVKYPHHRPSTAIGKAVPGMLSGGPNMGLHDPYAGEKLKGMPPSKCYIDGEPSYSTNEITIYWNSPLYCILSAFT